MSAKLSPLGLMALLFAFRGECAVDREFESSAKRDVPVSLTETEREWVRNHPHLRWGADPHWPPFSCLNRQGILEGIDADITRLVIDRIGLQVTFVPAASWSDVFPG